MEFHYLLAHRTRQQLNELDEPRRIALVAELVRMPPDNDVWWALLELLVSWPEGDEKDRQLTLANEALAAWDDRLRHVTSSTSFLYQDRQLASIARIVKSIDIYRREQNGSSELTAIVSSSNANGLTRLAIHRSEIASESWRLLVESRHLSNLESLLASNVVLSAPDVEALWQSHAFPNLRDLALVELGLHAKSIAGLCDQLPFPKLRVLDLSSNRLADDAARSISRASFSGQLARLILVRNRLTFDGVRALLDAPAGAPHSIDVSKCLVSEKDKPQLRELARQRNVKLTA